MVDGKWIRTCQTKIPALPKGQTFAVTVRPVPLDKRSTAASGFFSPKSFVDGFTNNVLGMVGLVTEGAASDDDFQVRMDRERDLAAKVAAKKAAKGASSE
jgi:hypothetical protein